MQEKSENFFSFCFYNVKYVCFAAQNSKIISSKETPAVLSFFQQARFS